MSATLTRDIDAWRTSDWYASRVRRQSIIGAAGALALASTCAGVILATDGSSLVLGLLGAVLVGLVICAHPSVGVYVVFGVAILFEQWDIPGLAPITANTRIFQNISAYTSIPLRLSIMDLLMLLTLVSWAARLGTARQYAFRMGPLGWAVLAYGSVFAIGTLIGVARGGWNLDAALAEARAPLQLCLAYFLAANLIRDRGQVAILGWAFVTLVGLKGLQGVMNAQAATGVFSYIDAVTSHEDVVFFDVAIGLACVMILAGTRTRLAYALFALLPLILGAELLTQRRVGFVALGAVVLVVALWAFVDSPRRALVFAAFGTLVLSAYLALFWEQTGPLGEPIRAVRAILNDPTVSIRDQLSDRWREIEDHNIAYTVRQLPLTGVGVGQAYLFELEPPPVNFVYWRFMTHNAVLWLWLKAGPLGAVALWFLVTRVLLVCSALYMRLRDPGLRWLAALPVLLVVAQIVFSSVELGLTYSRTMIVLGVGLGLAAFLVEAGKMQPETVRSTA